MTRRARAGVGAVPLFGLEARRPARRSSPALERTFTELRRLGVDEGPNGPTRRALLRTLCERFDAGSDSTLFASSTAARTIDDLLVRLAGEDTGAASFDELRALLSAPAVDEQVDAS